MCIRQGVLLDGKRGAAAYYYLGKSLLRRMCIRGLLDGKRGAAAYYYLGKSLFHTKLG